MARRDQLTRPAVSVTELTRSFGDRAVLDRISLDIADGEFVAVLGRSGSGKSTLLRALAELDHDVTGSGRIVTPAAKAVVFQDARLLPWASVLDNVTLGLRGDRSAATAKAEAALAEVGLAGRERAWPSDLSGGEQQRVALARALVREPALLLADEPFGALDALTRISMHQLLAALRAEHDPATVFVTHDVDEAILLADRTVVIGDGRIVLDRRVDVASPRRVSDPAFVQHRQALLAALGVIGDEDGFSPVASPSPSTVTTKE